MKKITTFFFLKFLCLALTGQSLAHWTFENITSAVPSTPIQASSHSWKVSSAYGSISGGNNNGSPDVCSGAESWSTNFWPTGSSRSTWDYLEFYATAEPGYDLKVSSFVFSSNVSSFSAARKYDVYYSLNGFSTSYYLGSGSNSSQFCGSHTYNLNAQTTSGGTITFRIYPYGQDPAAQAASMRVDNVSIRGAALLPVTLIEWKGETREEGIWLWWSTANEINSDYFSLEHRTQHTDFEEIDQINAKMNSSDRTDYHFFDAYPAVGTNYYRLIQVDVDGTKHYFDVIAIDYQPAQELTVTPTIASSEIRINLNHLQSSTVNLSILDLNGHRFFQNRYDSSESSTRIMIEHLKPGIYVLIAESRTKRMVARFVKQ